jgi:homospermidine synthase
MAPPSRIDLPGRVLVIGFGSVAQCTLPMLLERLPIPADHFTVIDKSEPSERAAKPLLDRGVRFERVEVTEAGYAEVLSARLGRGDLLIDLAWNIDTTSLLEWCRDAGVLFVNASYEVWDPYDDPTTRPTARTLYVRHMRLRQMLARWGDNSGPTAVLDHGANPGLVSHLTKLALSDIAEAWADEASRLPALRRSDTSADVGDEADRLTDFRRNGSWNLLAEALGVKVIHISERDTQTTAEPKRENEFVNTWSVEGFHEEATAPAELGWGSHEKRLPVGAFVHDDGPRNQICLARPGMHTWVRSWVPCGEIVGMVIRHGEAFTISDQLTVQRPDGGVAYRPTVHYAYCPSDAAIASLHELRMRNYELQPTQRIMNDDIVEGRDELGCLVLGHRLRGWWTGSLLDIDEARQLAPGQNATTLQVAAAVLGAVLWLIEHPDQGVRVPDELPYDEILRHARPFLGPLVSRQVEWSPRQGRQLFPGFSPPAPPVEDEWQFSSFLVDQDNGSW